VTPIASFLIGLIAGFTSLHPRRAILAAIPAWLTVLVIQTWAIAVSSPEQVQAGHSPPSEIAGVGYWQVQFIALGFLLGIAASVSQLRAQRYDSASIARQNGSRLRLSGAVVLQQGLAVLATAVAYGAYDAASYAELFAIPHVGPGAGMPVTGALGVVLCVATLAGMMIARMWTSRSLSRQSPASHPG
jgi:hypothetical protein